MYHPVQVNGHNYQARVPLARELHHVAHILRGDSESGPVLVQFMRDHLSPSSYAELTMCLLDPDDQTTIQDVHLVMQKIITAGTARPFRAVAALTISAADSWRTLRARLIRAGIADPLTQLPDMHAVLDLTEDLISEGKKPADLESWQFMLYRPDPNAAPESFSEDEQMAAFGAFEAAFGKAG